MVIPAAGLRGSERQSTMTITDRNLWGRSGGGETIINKQAKSAITSSGASKFSSNNLLCFLLITNVVKEITSTEIGNM